MIQLFNAPDRSPAYQHLIRLLGIGFVVVVLAVGLSYLAYPSPVFTWQQLQELQLQEIPLYAFERGNLAFTLNGENYLLFERWLGNSFTPNLRALDVYGIFFGLSLAVLMAIVSTLPRFWFYIGSMITAFLLASFRWDVLLLFGSDSRYIALGIIMLFFAVLSLYHFFRTSAPFSERVTVFIALTAGTVLAVSLSGESPVALRLLTVNTLNAALVLLLIFIILIAHQVIASFVSLATASSKIHGLRQFLLISTIYLLNLWLAYLNRIGSMEWSYTIPAFVLFITSTLLTVHSIRQREPLYTNMLREEPLLVIFILAMATLSLATFGYFIASANDSALLSIHDLTLYAHIGYGMMFLVYIAANFLNVFQQNLPVAKVLYKPAFMPYFSYRLAGLIFTLALVFYNNWMAHVNHFTSGYYTALGDIYWSQPDNRAETFYKRAHQYSPYNQHACTALAQLEAIDGSLAKQLSYSVDANRFKPTEFTLLHTDHLYLLSGKAYEDIKLLRSAKKLFPASGVVLNNLGLAYARTGMTDSAEVYFRKARADARARNTADMNLLGLLAKTNVRQDSDSLFRNAPSHALSVKSNALALANRQGTFVTGTIELPKDSVFNLFSATMTANFLTNQTNKVDTAFISTCVAIARLGVNLSYRHMILPAAAKACYAAGQVNKAIQLLQEAIFLGTNEGANNYSAGLMAMDQGKHDVAISYFLYAINHNFSAASLANAVCLAEEGRIDEAIIAWDTISHRKDTTLHELAESMKRVLAAPASWFADLTDTERLYYALYRIPLTDSTLFNRLAAQISSEDLRAKAYLNRAIKYFAADELRLAARQYRHLQGLHLRDTELFAEIKYFELRLLAAQGRIDALQQKIDQGILFGPYREYERIYYEGLKHWAAGDTTAARDRFQWITRNNWYFDEGIVTAADFFMDDAVTAYRILSDALQVNPHSVKLLKAYIPVARIRGFDQYAADALETLRGLVTPEAFRNYVSQNQLSDLILQ